MDKLGRGLEAGFGLRGHGTEQEPYISGPDRVQMGYLGLDVPSQRHVSSERFHQLLQEIGDLHDRKQRDYGTLGDPFANVRASERWGVPAWTGALIRLNDKIVRLQTFARTGELANEGVDDNLRDIAVYALIALVLFEEKNPPIHLASGSVTWDRDEGL